MSPRAIALACGVVVAAAGLGCATARASAPTPLPALNPPDAPPRVVAEYQPDPPLPAEPVSAEAIAAPPRSPRPVRREPPRTAPEEPPGPRPAPPSQAPSLAMQNTGANAAAEQSVRGLLSQAARSLERVVYQTLDANGRAQYDIARRFMQQAEEALKARNVVFAGKLADKAATMAAVLVR